MVSLTVLRKALVTNIFGILFCVTGMQWLLYQVATTTSALGGFTHQAAFQLRLCLLYVRGSQRGV